MRALARGTAIGACALGVALAAMVGSMMVAVRWPGVQIAGRGASIEAGVGLEGASTFAPLSVEILTDLFGERGAARLLQTAAPSGAREETEPASPGEGDSDEPGSASGPPAPEELTESPDVRVGMRVDKAEARPGEVLTYSVDLRNVGKGVAHRLRVETHIPEHTTWVGSGSDVVCTGSGPGGLPQVGVCFEPTPPSQDDAGHIWIAYSDVRPGWRDTWSFTVRIDPDMPRGTLIVNHAHARVAGFPTQTSNEVSTRVA